MKSRLATIVFADLVGYSALMSQDQSATIGKIQSLKTRHLEPHVAEHGGDVLKRMGDGWMLSFPSVSSALVCCFKVQKNLFSYPDIKLRIGCHLGEIIEDHDDYYGSGINLAQRIQTEAPPGGVMISEDLYRQLSDGQKADLSDAGLFSLKNIAQSVRLFQWRPAESQNKNIGEVPSIAVHSIEHAPLDDETRSVAEDLKHQLLARMSKRLGISIFDGTEYPDNTAVYDLKGRLRLADGRGRLTLALVLQTEGRPVWTETYQAATEDIFGFCDQLLEAAEADLRLQTNAFDGDRLAGVPEDMLSISELRARAANDFYRNTARSWQDGLALMERARQLNSKDAIALAMRAEAETVLHAARYEAMRKDLADEIASDLHHSVTSAPRSDYVFWMRGLYRIRVLNDPEGAQSDLERSAAINPAYLVNHELDGQIRMRRGNFDGAVQAFSRIIDRSAKDPLLPNRLFLRAVARFCADDFEGAERDAALAFDLHPHVCGHTRLRLLALEQLGEQERASHLRETLMSSNGGVAISAGAPALPEKFDWLLDELRPR